jgi:hypothetical protein
MMDKWQATWQQLNPDTWVEPHLDLFGTYTRDTNEMVDNNAALTPFRLSKDEDAFLSSADMRDWTNFGYDYPLLEGNPSRQDLLDTVKNMYSNFGTTAASCTLLGQFENCITETCNDPALSTAENC